MNRCDPEEAELEEYRHALDAYLLTKPPRCPTCGQQKPVDLLPPFDADLHAAGQ